jgi:O-antigen ligase
MPSVHTVSDIDQVPAVRGGRRSPAAERWSEIGTWLLQALLWLGLAGGGVLLGERLVLLGLARVSTLAVMLAIGLAISPLIGFRGVSIAGLLFAMAIPITKHVTYRAGHIGSADGVTIELLDLWLFAVIAQYAYLRKVGQANPVRGLGAFCMPLALLLFADMLSFRHAGDMELSFYGLLADVRGIALFLMITVMLAQGREEKRAAMTGLMWNLIVIGGICTAQLALGVNFGVANDPYEGFDGSGGFRAAGMGNATTTASYLAIVLPLVFVEVAGSEKGSRKRFAMLSMTIGLLGLVATMTRTALGLLLLGSLPLIAYLLKERILKLRHVMAALIVVAILAAALAEKIAARVDEGSDNVTARYGLIGTALNMAADSPITGQGVNNYMVKMDRFAPKLQIHHFVYVVHNKYLLVLAETGVIGLTAFIWFLLVALGRAFSLARRGSMVGLGLLCALLVAVADMNMEPFASGFPFFAICAVAAFTAASWSSAKEAEQSMPVVAADAP